MRNHWVLFLVLVLAVAGLSGFPKEKPEPDNVRSVEGVVWDASEQPVEGAVVHLKNTKTLQIRTFVTLANGNYYFHGLNTNVDYELKAAHKQASSPVRRLSTFDSRKKAIINLKLDSK